MADFIIVMLFSAVCVFAAVVAFALAASALVCVLSLLVSFVSGLMEGLDGRSD